jgi:hypothetical protein
MTSRHPRSFFFWVNIIRIIDGHKFSTNQFVENFIQIISKSRLTCVLQAYEKQSHVFLIACISHIFFFFINAIKKTCELFKPVKWWFGRTYSSCNFALWPYWLLLIYLAITSLKLLHWNLRNPKLFEPYITLSWWCRYIITRVWL